MESWKQKHLLRLAFGLTFLVIWVQAGIFCFGCNSIPDQSEPETQKISPRVGDPAIDFSLPNLHGQTVTLKDFKKQIIVLNFWTTWCRYCVGEMDLLERAHLNDNQVTVLAVNVNENEDLPRRFVAEKGLTFPVLLDQTGELFMGYGLSGFPSTIIINRQGIITSIWIGVMDANTLQQLLETAL